MIYFNYLRKGVDNMKALLDILLSLMNILSGTAVEIQEWDIQKQIMVDEVHIELVSISENDGTYTITLNFENFTNDPHSPVISFQEGKDSKDKKTLVQPNSQLEKTYTYSKDIGTPLYLVVWKDETVYRHLLTKR